MGIYGLTYSLYHPEGNVERKAVGMSSSIVDARGLDIWLKCRSSSEFTGMMQTKRWIRGKEKSYKRTQMKQDKEQENKDSRHRLRPQKGIINGYTVDTLRDSGCTAICVNRKLVRADQFTGQYQTCTLIDGRETRFELARVNLNTPYTQKQGASVLCVKDLEYGIVVGDVPGARCKCDPNPN